MKTQTLDILNKVANGELTPEIAKNHLYVLFGVSNSGDFEIGSLIKRTKLPRGNGSQIGLYTVGKNYKIFNNENSISKVQSLGY